MAGIHSYKQESNMSNIRLNIDKALQRINPMLPVGQLSHVSKSDILQQQNVQRQKREQQLQEREQQLQEREQQLYLLEREQQLQEREQQIELRERTLRKREQQIEIQKLLPTFDSDTLLPCEFCHDIISITTFIEHQEKCQVRMKTEIESITSFKPITDDDFFSLFDLKLEEKFNFESEWTKLIEGLKKAGCFQPFNIDFGGANKKRFFDNLNQIKSQVQDYLKRKDVLCIYCISLTDTNGADYSTHINFYMIYNTGIDKLTTTINSTYNCCNHHMTPIYHRETWEFSNLLTCEQYKHIKKYCDTFFIKWTDRYQPIPNRQFVYDEKNEEKKLLNLFDL